MGNTSELVATTATELEPPHADLRAVAMRIKRAVRRQTAGGVLDLEVRIDADAIRLHGRCASFYHKQLAQHAAMRLADGAAVINEIEVGNE